MKVFYGSNSWANHLEEKDFIEACVEAAVDVEYIEDSGHHVYADQYKALNEALNSCLMKHHIGMPKHESRAGILNFYPKKVQTEKGQGIL
jgi:hypothetical protein